MSDIVERLRDYKKRFIFQGASQFALGLAADIERLRAENAKLKSTDMAVALTEMSLRDEITRLRARVEKLERIRAAADNLFTYDSGWSHWEKKYRALRDALKEAKP
jgi:uncharacterized small protein (DUF1192 family)